MKSPITTSFSIVAVLIAGVAAAVVNTQALQARTELPIGDAAAVATTAPVVATDTNVVSPEVVTIVEEEYVVEADADAQDGTTATDTVQPAQATNTTVGKTSTSTTPVQNNVLTYVDDDDHDDDDHDDDDHDDDDHDDDDDEEDDD